MIYEYVIKKEYDFEDYPTAQGTWETISTTCEHGFWLEIDENDVIDFGSIKGFGDYACEISNVKNFEEFKSFLLKHLDEVEDFDFPTTYTNRECFEELIEFVEENIEREKAA